MPKTVNTQQYEVQESTAEQNSFKHEFYTLLCANLPDKLDVDGLAGQVAEEIAPQLFNMMKVGCLADMVVANHGTELAERLAQEFAKRLVE